MIKLLTLERNVMLRAFPILAFLALVSGGSYTVTLMQERGSDLQVLSATVTAIAMAALTGFALALLLVQQGLKRLRVGS